MKDFDDYSEDSGFDEGENYGLAQNDFIDFDIRQNIF